MTLHVRAGAERRLLTTGTQILDRGLLTTDIIPLASIWENRRHSHSAPDRTNKSLPPTKALD
jgi:hypothetical protein